MTVTANKLLIVAALVLLILAALALLAVITSWSLPTALGLAVAGLACYVAAALA